MAAPKLRGNGVYDSRKESAMKHAVLALIAVFSAAGVVSSQSKKKDLAPGQGIDWKSDWDAAVEEATARNVPIHFAIHQDGDANSKAITDAVFTDPKVIELSRSFVNVIAHNETAHGDHELVVGREKLKLCNEYLTVPCSVHTKGWSAVTKFIQGNFTVPTRIFADPQGKEIGKSEGPMSAKDLISKMNDALAKVPGDHIHSTLWQTARRLAADSDAWLAKGEPKKAAECLVKLSRIKGAPIKAITDEAAERANEAGRKALQAALALGAGEVKKKAVREVIDDYKPLDVSAEAKKELDGLK